MENLQRSNKNLSINAQNQNFYELDVINNRKKRIAPAVIIAGIGLFVNGVNAIAGIFQRRAMKNSMEKNFKQVLQKIERNYEAINKNYDAIKTVERAVDRNFVILKKVQENVQEILSEIEKLRNEMREGFETVLSSITDSEIRPVITKLNDFVQFFSSETAIIKNLPEDERFQRLSYLERAKTPREDGLRSSLFKIIDQGYGIPKNAEDKTKFAALYSLYYGTYTLVSLMLFLLEQYSYLADYCYQNGDLEGYNKYLDSIQNNFEDFKLLLLDDNVNSLSLIDTTIHITGSVQGLEFVENLLGPDSKKILLERINVLKEIKKNVKNLVLPILNEIPPKMVANPTFKPDGIDAPVGEWQIGTSVSYAIQYRNGKTYSKIGKWSDPLKVTGKTNPVLTIPVDKDRNARLIFRKFSNQQKPDAQLVGVLEEPYYETKFEDIDRDLYNSALNFNATIGLIEAKIFINNGANATAIFEDGRRAFHAAAQRNNVQIGELLMSQNGIDLNVKDDKGFTPLHVAAEAAHEDFINFLIKHKAKIDSKTEENQSTPLHLAAYKGYDSTVKILSITEQTNVNAKEKGGFTPLHSAVFSGIKVVKALLPTEINVNINSKTDQGLTPLHLASIGNYVDVAQILLTRKNIDVNAISEGNFTALHFASMSKNSEMVKVLLAQNDTNVNAKSVNGFTPLHYAISLENIDVINELLMNNNTLVSAEAMGGIKPLHVATFVGNENIILDLLAKEPNVTVSTNEGLEPLHIAAYYKHGHLIPLLLERGAQLESKTLKGLTPFHFSISSPYSDLDNVKYFINLKADFNSIPYSGGTHLHLAAKSGNLDILKYFLNRHYDINGKDKEGNTPLHHAAENGHLNLVTYLIDKKADIKIKNDFGKNVFHSSIPSGNLTLVKYLAERGFDVNEKDGNEDGPLHMAVNNYHFDIVKFLILERNAFINAKDKAGKTVLHLSTIGGNLDLVKFLIKNDADLYAKDIDGNAPLLSASKNGRLNIIKYFIDVKKVDLNVTCNFSSRSLAALNGHLETFKYLASKEKKFANFFNNCISLYSATKNGHLDIIRNIPKLNIAVTIYEDIPLALFALLTDYLHKEFKDDDVSTINYFTKLLLRNMTHIKDITTFNKITYTNLLYLSVNFHQLPITKYLIDEKYVDINNSSEIDQIKVLHYAAAVNNLEVVIYLLEEKKIDINIEDDDGMTPLLYSAKCNHFDMLKYFINKKAKLISNKGKNPLVFATANNNFEMVKYLLENTKVLNLQSTEGYILDLEKIFDTETEVDNKKFYFASPLSNAIKNGLIEMTKLLTERGIDVNFKEQNGATPLHIAAENGHFEIVKHLVEEYKANFKTKDNDSKKALYYAAKNGYLNIVLYLKDKNNGIDDLPLSLIKISVENGHLNMVKYLREKGARLDNYYAITASEKGHLDLLKYLIKEGLSVHTRSQGIFDYNKTLLHFAAANGHLDVVRYLVDEKNADKYAKDSYDWTPLHYAAYNGDLEIIKYFINEKLMDPYLKTSKYETPLTIALSYNKVSVAKFILEKKKLGSFDQRFIKEYLKGITKFNLEMPPVYDAIGKTIDANNKFSHGFLSPERTLLEEAVFSGNYIVAKHLIDVGADVNVNTAAILLDPFEKKKLLHILAANNGSLDMVKYLVQHGANVYDKANISPQIFELLSANNIEVSEGENNLNPSYFAHLCCNKEIFEYMNTLEETLHYMSSSSSRINSGINNVINYVKQAAQSFFKYYIPSLTNNENTLISQSSDVNSTLLLLDVFVRKISGIRYVSTLEQNISDIDAQNFALNITYTLEEFLKKTSEESNTLEYFSKIDFSNIQSQIFRKIISSSEYGEVSKILDGCIKKVSSSSFEAANHKVALDLILENSFKNNKLPTACANNKNFSFDVNQKFLPKYK